MVAPGSLPLQVKRGWVPVGTAKTTAPFLTCNCTPASQESFRRGYKGLALLQELLTLLEVGRPSGPLKQTYT